VVRGALARGHRVTGFTRDPAKLEEADPNISWKAIDVLDADSVRRTIGEFDVLISLYQPGNASKDFGDSIARAIADPSVYVTAAKALLCALEDHPRTRLIVVGGAGSLEIRPGMTNADSPEELRRGLQLLGACDPCLQRRIFFRIADSLECAGAESLSDRAHPAAK
jgi:putative NADH-flavin reductase